MAVEPPQVLVENLPLKAQPAEEPQELAQRYCSQEWARLLKLLETLALERRVEEQQVGLLPAVLARQPYQTDLKPVGLEASGTKVPVAQPDLAAELWGPLPSFEPGQFAPEWSLAWEQVLAPRRRAPKPEAQ
jgi:hypothetical protein